MMLYSNVFPPVRLFIFEQELGRVFHVSICCCTAVAEKELRGDQLPGINQILSVRYRRWAVMIDAATLHSVCTICWHSWENTFSPQVHIYHAASATRVNRWRHLPKKQQTAHVEPKQRQMVVFWFKSCRPKKKSPQNKSVPVCIRRWKAWYFTVTLFPFAIALACVSEAARGQSQMKLVSIKPFQIRQADGKRAAFKATAHSHFLAQSKRLFSWGAIWECIMVTALLMLN